ncbi:MAG: class I SAM-dependent methyltransferase [Ideonella sp.]|nr:class I SAM-dependent methyltransferase [Ideonella sp.]
MHALLATIAALPLPTEACRVFHGRGGLHEGCEQWSLDFYPPVWLLTSFAPVTDEELAQVGEALATRWAELTPGQPLNWVFQHRDEYRPYNCLMAGGVPTPHIVSEHGARYEVHLLRGQNHGLFLDMAAGRQWVQRWAQAHPRGRVLNLFAYTCAFSVVARLAGAGSVLNFDMAKGPLAQGQRNHELNGVQEGTAFMPHDIFSSWGKITRRGPYDLVIADPPSYQKGSFVATKDYARLVRRLPDLIAPGGHALLALNAPELGPQFLLDLVQQEAPMFTLVERVANPPSFADVDEDRALKVLVFQRQAQGAAATSAA